MRLFAAVLPPEAQIAELATEVDLLHTLPGADRLSWTERPGWHFTLAFYGEVPDDIVPELKERLGRAAHRHHPFGLRLAGGGRFSDRVVWAGAEGDREAMQRLADSAAAGARRAGVSMDEHRSYHPHLTIARNRTDMGIREYVEALGHFQGTAWTVGELSLVRSNLPRGGTAGEQPRYEAIASWPLGG